MTIDNAVTGMLGGSDLNEDEGYEVEDDDFDEDDDCGFSEFDEEDLDEDIEDTEFDPEVCDVQALLAEEDGDDDHEPLPYVEPPRRHPQGVAVNQDRTPYSFNLAALFSTLFFRR